MGLIYEYLGVIETYDLNYGDFKTIRPQRLEILFLRREK